jgi:LuxR family quorum-sensing transcriptional regulator LasR
MKSAERFSDLMSCDSLPAWRDLVFNHGNRLGYKRILLSILPDHNMPLEAEFAFLHSNYPTLWLNTYDERKYQNIDPTVTHCKTKSTPLVWTSEVFSTPKQKEMYQAACGYGLRSGVTLPIHGAQGELGILCLVNDTQPDHRAQLETHCKLPELSYFRDLILETSLHFMAPANSPQSLPHLTTLELECIKWCAAGKSSWEIAKIFHRSESAVNLHFKNLRRKFSVSSRQQVVLKAMIGGLIQL